MPDFLSDFHQVWIMSTDFYKTSQNKKKKFSLKSDQWGLRWNMLTDGGTDMTKVIGALMV
jgi:hypothetical protein